MNSAHWEILKKRIKKYIAEIQDDIYGQFVPLTAEVAVVPQRVCFQRVSQLQYHPIHEGEPWGKEWESGYFRMTVQIPESWAGAELCLRINLGGESTLFDESGTPLYGFSAGSIYDRAYVKERFLLSPEKYQPGTAHEFCLEAVCMQLWGVHPATDAKPDGDYQSHANIMRLCEFRRPVWQLKLDLDILDGLLDCSSGYKARLLTCIISKALDAYGHNPDNAPEALRILSEAMNFPAAASAPEAWCVGHSHIDIAWKWPIQEGRRKAARTFASQLALMDKYPDFIYGSSQAALYAFIKEDYPELFRKIKEKVKSGQWELQGGTWVEADSNMISGESMIRQFLYGKKFFQEEFGVEPDVLWLPDIFGHSAIIPQIAVKSGCPFFIGQKVCWSQFNDFPYHSFRWKGIDGTELLTHMLPERSYGSTGFVPAAIKGADNYQESAITRCYGVLFGIGDGGGGPSEDYVERYHRLKNLEGVPRNRFAGMSSFMAELRKYEAALPVWDDEIYLELHRGALTSQAQLKRGNRCSEQLLAQLEFLCSCGDFSVYPADEIEAIWKKVLLLQFHDIIAGTSIHKVNEQALEDYREIAREIESLSRQAEARVFQEMPDAMVLTNSLAYHFCHSVELPAEWAQRIIRDATGKLIPTQQEDGKVIAYVSIPKLSCLTLYAGEHSTAQTACPDSRLVCENDLVRYEFSADGRLQRAFDKELNREMLSAPGNALTLYHDVPNSYDAWDVDIFYTDERSFEAEVQSAKSIARGPVRSLLEFTYHVHNSTIHQFVALDQGSKRLDFITTVQWQEEHQMLRVNFPVAFDAREATFDIPYGNIRRPLHSNTSWEQAKFEVAGQQYADISDSEGGIALLNDCKFGYRCKGNMLDLCLMRSPKEPDCFADHGTHSFTYSLLPHAGALEDSNVIQEAAVLNRLPRQSLNCAAKQPPICPVTIDAQDISLTAIKKAEREDSLILRLVETSGRKSRGRLLFRQDFTELVQTDMLERPEHSPVRIESKEFDLTLKPFEILTLMLRK